MADPDVVTAESLAAEFRHEIRTGQRAPGDKLPSIRELVETRGAGRGVAEKALERLRREGLVEARPGSGNYVRDGFARIRRVSPGRLLRAQWAAGTAIQDHDTGPRPREERVFVADVVPPADVAQALGVRAGVEVLSRFRRFVVNGRPVQLSTSYLPTELTRGTRIEQSDTGPGGTYRRLDEQGWGPTDFVEKTIGRAALPDEVTGTEQRPGLSLRRGAMVFEITRLAYCRGRCVEVNRMVLDADAYEIIFQFSA